MNERSDGRLALFIMKMVPDMRLVSVFMIITGVFSCLSIVGLVAGIPLIMAGVKLKNAAAEFNRYTAGENPQPLDRGTANLKEHFRMLKWHYILTLTALLIFAVLSVFIFQALIYFLAGIGVRQ